MNFSERLLNWYDANKRDLPWRKTRDPYIIWISEIMLQQTRVETVKEYYLRFLQRFPTIEALAGAKEEEVFKAWEGLGYYSRARNLQKAARYIVSRYQGVFPGDYVQILSLPGIGPYTAGAISSIAFSVPVPAVDGNVKRVATRFFGIRTTIESQSTLGMIEKRLAEVTSSSRPGDFNQAMIELGATVCNPAASKCDFCPLREACDAYAEGDASLLPLHEKKPVPKTVDMGVTLLSYQGKILLFQRKERLLNGLFVFFLSEDDVTPAAVGERLLSLGLSADYRGALGHARHVFTHRVWEMEIFHFELSAPPAEEFLLRNSATWAEKGTLSLFPIPTAMKAAKEKALDLLQ